MIKIMQVSDFHFVNDPDGQNFKKLLLRTAKEEFANLDKDKKLLVITGDFHFYNETNFNQSYEYICELVRAMGIEMRSDVFLVPGNHDVCSSEDDLQALGQEATVEKVKKDHNALHDKEKKNLPRLLTRFEKYAEFCVNLGIYSDASIPATVHIRSWRKRLNIVHLNTCLIADGSEKTNQLLDTTALTSLENEKGLPCIVLGHNSFFDLAEKVQTQSYPAFDRLDARAYLCGDRHKYERNRYQYDIILDGLRGSDHRIPNIVSCKCSADESDDFSDIGCIIHRWDETTGEVYFDILTWDSKDDQNYYEVKSNHGTYDLSISTPIAPDPKEAKDTQIEERDLNYKEQQVIEKYQRYIRSNCTEIELNGLPKTEADLKRKYELSKLFVPLRFFTTSPIIDKDTVIQTVSPDEGLSEVNSNLKYLLKTPALEEIILTPFFDDDYTFSERHRFPGSFTKRISIAELIPSESRFTYLILADPGAGKTTLLKRIASAYCFPKEYFDDSGLTCRDLFPIWIRCRDITDNDYSIWKEIQSIPTKGELSIDGSFSMIFSSIIKTHIENGTALLLIDGLDEIGSENGRKRFVEHLNGFIKNNPKLNVIITSREKGFSIISEGAFSDFTTFRIANLNNDDRDMLKRIVTGRYKQNLKDFFIELDNNSCEGYDCFTSVYEILSGEISNPIEYYHKNTFSKDDKLRAKALSVLSNWSYLGSESSIVGNVETKNEIVLSAFEALRDENRRVAASGFELLRMCDLIKSNAELSTYINSLCNYINRYKKIPHIIMPTVLTKYLESGIEAIVTLDKQSLEYVCKSLKDNSPLSSDDYFDEIVLLLTVSICSDDVKGIETFYAVLEEERPANLNRYEIRQEIQLLNKIEETICSSNAVMEETKLCIVKYKTNVLNTIPPDKLEDLNSLD